MGAKAAFAGPKNRDISTLNASRCNRSLRIPCSFFAHLLSRTRSSLNEPKHAPYTSPPVPGCRCANSIGFERQRRWLSGYRRLRTPALRHRYRATAATAAAVALTTDVSERNVEGAPPSRCGLATVVRVRPVVRRVGDHHCRKSVVPKRRVVGTPKIDGQRRRAQQRRAPRAMAWGRPKRSEPALRTTPG